MAYRSTLRYLCAVRIPRKRHNVPGPKRDGLLAKRLWDRRKDEWTPDHSTRQYQEKQKHFEISPALPQTQFYTGLKSWEAKFFKNSFDRNYGKGKASERIPCYGESFRGQNLNGFSPTAAWVCRRLVASTCKEIGPGLDVVTTTR